MVITNKKAWQYLFLFGLLSIALLAPIGSVFSTYAYLPKNDFRGHSALIMQARMAIDEGQFPIRVAPWEHQQLRYPEYQFYSVLPFTIAGYLYKFFMLTHSQLLKNPFNTLKLIILMTITIGGIYIYRFSRLFTKSDIIALLAATAYLYSPYMIFNITLNGDFTEIVALGLLPVALYYSTRLLLSTQCHLQDGFFSTLAWFSILTSHLITFAYGILFFVPTAGLFLMINPLRWKRFLLVMAAIGYAGALAAWYIVPVGELAPFLAASQGAHLGLTPTSIFNLLAIKSGGTDVSPSYPGFYASIGWPFIFALFGCVYFLIWPKDSRHNDQYKKMLGITFLFLAAVVMAWSWINFWKYLPYFLSIGQFGHRFLAQIMWLGVILFIFAVQNIFHEPLDARHLIIGIFLICFASSSWLVKPQDGLPVSSLLAAPEINAGAHDYFIRPDTLAPYPGLKKYGFVQIPLEIVDGELLLNHPVQLPSYLLSPDTILILKGMMQTSASPGLLVIKLGQQVIATKQIKQNEAVNWMVPIGQFYVEHFHPHENIALTVSAILANNQTVPDNLLPMLIDKFVLASKTVPQMTILPVDKSTSSCIHDKNSTRCSFTNDSDEIAAQLPVMYYPKIQDVLLDGKPVQYEPSFYRNDLAIKQEELSPVHDQMPFMLTTVLVPKGKHSIVVEENGIHWANTVSILAWGLLGIFGLILVMNTYFRKDG